MTFLSVGGGVLLCVVAAVLVDRFIYQKGLIKDEKGRIQTEAPEERLYVGMLGAFLLPIG